MRSINYYISQQK